MGHDPFGLKPEENGMPSRERFKTTYPGVYYVMGTAIGNGKPERIYRIRYRRDEQLIEENAGRQFQNDMTPAKAARLRARRIDGDQLSNTEKRKELAAQKEAEENLWTFDRLWKAYKGANPGLKGIVTDENRFEKHILPTFGEKEPKEVIPLDVDRLRVRLLKTKKPGTVKNVLELLRRLINFGIKKRLCEGPGFTIPMPRVDNIKTEDLTPEQIDSLFKALDEAPNVQVANFMRMVLFTGMRRGELFRLKWRDIDFDRGFILIRNPKGGTGQKIPLNKEARSLLRRHPRSNNPFVFPGRNGKQRQDITHDANKIKMAAGLPEGFRALHGLRHVYASMLASSGKVDMYTLQRLLTHKNPAMTQRYAHLRDEVLRQASDLAGPLLRKQAKEGKAASLRNSG